MAIFDILCEQLRTFIRTNEHEYIIIDCVHLFMSSWKVRMLHSSNTIILSHGHSKKRQTHNFLLKIRPSDSGSLAQN